MTTIYRIQDFEGRGPFRPGFSSQWVESRPDHELLMPAYRDFDWDTLMKGMIHGAWHGVGCPSVKVLRRWFIPVEYQRLIRFGYRAVQMDVDRVLAENDTQCVFERAKPLTEDVIRINLYDHD